MHLSERVQILELRYEHLIKAQSFLVFGLVLLAVANITRVACFYIY